MPEGHTIHRLAADHHARFAGRKVQAASPQGKFADGAALLDGTPLHAAEAHGKHLFLDFAAVGLVHIHLGLYGTIRFGTGPVPAPVGQIRLRLHTPADWSELRGPTRCQLITPGEKRTVTDRLGPDPLRPDADPDRAWTRIQRSRTPVAALLLDQKIIAGVGNVYRAEVLFRHGIDPYRLGRDLTRREWDALWCDLVGLLHAGVRAGRIDTVRPEHEPSAMGRPPRVDDHGGEVYVYRRAGQACHVCADEVRSVTLAARNLFWCPTCQPR